MALHRNHAAENITIKACDDSGKLFLFVSPLGEKHLGAAGISRPVVGCDSALIDKMNSLLSTHFPTGTVIQFAQFASPDVDEIINIYEAGKQGGPEVLAQLCHEHAELYRKAKTSPLVRASGVLANHKRVFFGIKLPIQSASPSDAEIKEVQAAIEAAFDSLSAAQIHMTRMDEKAYRQFVHAMHNPWAKEKDSVVSYDETTTLDQQILPVGMSIDYNHNKAKNTISFNDGEYFARVLSVNFLPHRAYPWVMNDVIGDWTGINNQVTDPYFLSVTVTYPDQEKTKQSLLMRSAQINNQAGSTIVKLLPEVGERQRRINTMVNELKASPVMVKMTWSMIVYSKEERQLERLTNSLVSYYSTLGRGDKKFDIKVDKRILRPLFEQAIPLNATAKCLKGTFRTKTVGARHAAALLPLYGDLTFTPSLKGSLVVTRRGEPAIIDPFDSNTNYNGLIFAESGAGKSVQVQALMLDHLAAGGRVWAIDDGRSMEKMCRVLGGQFISFSKNSEVCLNPFTTIKPGGLDEELDLLKTMFMKMAAPQDGLSDNQMAKLERAIIQSYENYANTASVRSVADFLLDQDDPESRKIGEQLFSFASGQYSRWFDGDANINFSSKLVVLEMGDLKQLPHLKDVVALQLFALITRGMREITDDSRKMLVIEEAKQWLYDPIMAKGIEEAFARARKDKGSAVAVTQSLVDIIESPSGKSIMQNAAWLMMLSQKPASIRQAIEDGYLDLDAYGAKILESVSTVRGAYAEFMYKKEGAYGVYRSVHSRFLQVMLSTTGAERTAVLQAMDNGIPAKDAINEFIQQERRAAHANSDDYRLTA